MKSCNYNFSIVKTLRNSRGLTLEALSSETGLSIRTISDIELNKAVPSIASLVALSRSFGVSPTNLFEMSQKTVPQQLVAHELPSGKEPGLLVELKDMSFVHRKYDEASQVELVGKEIQTNPCNQVIYIFSGKATVVVEGVEHNLESGMSLCFTGNLRHKIKYDAGTEVVIFYLPRDNQIAKELANAHHYLTY